MTRATNARIAGSSLLLYIALGIGSMVLFGKATHGEGIAVRLAGIAEHAFDVRVAAALTLFCSFCALALAVSLYALTRDVDSDLATMGLAFRLAEGVIGGISIQTSLGLVWLATATGPDAPDSHSAQALGMFLLKGQGSGAAAIFFAVGSAIFSWLLLRGRMIPTALAWLGVIASVLWIVGLPLQLVRVLPGSVVQLLYIPMAAYEIPLGLWLLIKGVAAPVQTRS